MANESKVAERVLRMVGAATGSPAVRVTVAYEGVAWTATVNGHSAKGETPLDALSALAVTARALVEREARAWRDRATNLLAAAGDES